MEAVLVDNDAADLDDTVDDENVPARLAATSAADEFIAPFDFKVTRVYDAQCDRAAPMCVLTPLLGVDESKAAAGVSESLAKLREAWAARVVALRAAGWGRVPTRRAAAYVVNCPPFGVRTGTESRVCRCAAVCPFCFGRYRVTETFIGLAAALRPGLEVVWFRRRVVGTSAAGLDAHVHQMRRYVAATRRHEPALFKAVSGTVQFDIFPLSRDGERVAVRRAGVLLVPRGTGEDALALYHAVQPADGPPVRVSGGVLPATKGNLAAAFARAVPYPAKMMTGPAAWAAAALNALAKFKLCTSFGR